jgi:hypothetical protein
MAINYTTLRNEIENDPTNLGYAADRLSGADSLIADKLNAVSSANRINTGSLTTDQLKACVTLSDYTGLQASNRQWLDFISVAQFIDLNNTVIAGGLNTLFTAGSTSRNNIIAAQKRDGSRAETLFGAGTYISIDDVAKARGTGW